MVLRFTIKMQGHVRQTPYDYLIIMVILLAQVLGVLSTVHLGSLGSVQNSFRFQHSLE